MTKTVLHLSIDSRVVEDCKLRGVNMSRNVEDYLKVLLGKQEIELSNKTKLVETLEQDLAKAKIEQLQYEAMLETKRKESLAQDFKEREAFINSGEFFSAIKKLEKLKRIKSNYGPIAYEAELLKLVQITHLDRDEIEKKFTPKETSILRKAK